LWQSPGRRIPRPDDRDCRHWLWAPALRGAHQSTFGALPGATGATAGEVRTLVQNLRSRVAPDQTRCVESRTPAPRFPHIAAKRVPRAKCFAGLLIGTDHYRNNNR
jgi:hypothetical protein